MMNAPKKSPAAGMAPTGPQTGAAAPAGPGGMGGGLDGTQFGRDHMEFSQTPPPDPAQFLKIIWDRILSPHQKELVLALLQDPAAAGGAPPPGAPAPLAQ